jgi:hypothetical protein
MLIPTGKLRRLHRIIALVNSLVTAPPGGVRQRIDTIKAELKKQEVYVQKGDAESARVSLEIAELEARHILKALHLPEDI